MPTFRLRGEGGGGGGGGGRGEGRGEERGVLTSPHFK